MLTNIFIMFACAGFLVAFVVRIGMYIAGARDMVNYGMVTWNALGLIWGLMALKAVQ